MTPEFEPTPFTGRIHAERGGPHRTAALFLHDPDRDGRYWVRNLTEDEVAQLAQQFADMLDGGPASPVDRDQVLLSSSAARRREAELPALRAARLAGGAR